jgi:hypothetical protein
MPDEHNTGGGSAREGRNETTSEAVEVDEDEVGDGGRCGVVFEKPRVSKRSMKKIRINGGNGTRMVFDEETGEALNPLVQMMRGGLGSKYVEVSLSLSLSLSLSRSLSLALSLSLSLSLFLSRSLSLFLALALGLALYSPLSFSLLVTGVQVFRGRRTRQRHRCTRQQCRSGWRRRMSRTRPSSAAARRSPSLPSRSSSRR